MEDARLFPELSARHPELRPVIARLEQDHRMIAHLLAGLEAAVQQHASRENLARHLDGIGAIMESHFRYEERQLLSVLADLRWAAPRDAVLGPL